MRVVAENYEQTTWGNYSNPRCAHARRGLINNYYTGTIDIIPYGTVGYNNYLDYRTLETKGVALGKGVFGLAIYSRTQQPSGTARATENHQLPLGNHGHYERPIMLGQPDAKVR